MLPPEVLRTCLLLPLQVAWHNPYLSIFVLCCWLWHTSSGALNCGKLPVCFSMHDHSTVIEFGRDFQKLSVQIFCSKQRVITHNLLACSPEHPNSATKIYPEPLSQLQATVAPICSLSASSAEHLPTEDFFKIAASLATKKLTCQVNKTVLATTQCATRQSWHAFLFCHRCAFLSCI